MSTIFPRRERRENTADESFVDLEAEGPMTSSPAKEITVRRYESADSFDALQDDELMKPLPPVPPLLNLNRSYSDPQLVYGAQVYPQGRSPTPYSSNSPNASGMISASQSQDDAMPHSGSGVDSRAHPADHGLLATVQMDKAEVAATVGPLITVGMQNLTKAQTAVDKVVASEAWSVVKENVTAILAPAKDVGLILDSITKYIPALVAAKSLFTVIIKHELERYENDKNILVVYHIMSIFWFTMCDLQAIFRADRIQTTLDIFFQDVEKTTWDFGNFREVYYRHGHFARSLRSSEYRKKLVSFALEFINHKANLQFILTEGSAIQLGDLTADVNSVSSKLDAVTATLDWAIECIARQTPLEVYIVKQVQNNGGEKVLQDKMFLNAIAKNSFNMEEISPQLQASLRQGLDEALSANLPMFTLKVVAAQKEISEAIERSTKSILQQLNSGHSSSVWLSDFSGRQVSIPWQRCRSWQDLCLYLDVVFEGIQESRFIRTRSFGIHIPNQGDLLSHESWNSWVSAIDEDLWENPPTLELYAIMKDDSDRCPHCNITHPATKPLPDLGHQQCLACKGTFLERFEHEVVSCLAFQIATSTTRHNHKQVWIAMVRPWHMPKPVTHFINVAARNGGRWEPGRRHCSVSFSPYYRYQVLHTTLLFAQLCNYQLSVSSLEAYWIIWGVFYFAIFIMAFLWRSGAMDEPDKNSRPSKTAAYGPRIATTLVFTAGTVYLGLVIVVVRKM